MSSVLTVSQLNKYISFKIKSDLKLKGIAVKGEISNFTVHYKSGHAYFTIKDDGGTVKAVMFSGNVQKLKFVPENGMNVLVVGSVEVYERDGVYQIVATEITPLGAGLIHRQIELVKEKLIKNGVFDSERKKTVPAVPKKIAVVTSLNGAALQDILHITERRYPMCVVEIYPAQVQGADAPQSICEALSAADSSGADTLILARGGGSLEDLMPFNTEQVAVAVSECVTPIISAVGHETDTTLCDYAADMRAPTPSAAAEIATPELQDMVGTVNLLRTKLDAAINKYIDNLCKMQEGFAVRLKLSSPENRIEADIRKYKELDISLRTLMLRKTEILSMKLDGYAARLNSLSPFNVLGRGYALVQKGENIAASVKNIEAGDIVTIRLSDGEAYAEIKETRELPKG